MFDRDKDGFIDTDEFKTVTPMKMKNTFINISIASVSVSGWGQSFENTHGVFFNSLKMQRCKRNNQGLVK